MLFDALSDHGQAQTVMDMLMNADVPGYAHVVKIGLITLPESLHFLRIHKTFLRILWSIAELLFVGLKKSGIVVEAALKIDICRILAIQNHAAGQ